MSKIRMFEKDEERRKKGGGEFLKGGKF